MLATAVQEAPWGVDFMKSKTEAFAYRRRGQEGSVVHDVIVASAMRPLSRTSS
jgi:hypothetical protein